MLNSRSKSSLPPLSKACGDALADSTFETVRTRANFRSLWLLEMRRFRDLILLCTGSEFSKNKSKTSRKSDPQVKILKNTATISIKSLNFAPPLRKDFLKYIY